MSAGLTPYVPRLLLEWQEREPDVRVRAVEGTLVFADVSGFTRLSERLAKSGGKAGAEEMTDIVSVLFGELLTVAARRGGEMLKYGGDAVLLFFRGDAHAARACAASLEMQRRLREVGRVEAGGGVVRLRMSVGVNTGTFDLFKVGGSHEELVIAGPATTETVAMEAAADAGDVLVSAVTAAIVGDRVLGASKASGRLLVRAPQAPTTAPRRVRPTPIAAHFVSPRLRDHLRAGGGDSEHRLATIAFLHVLGVDSLLAMAGPEDVARRLQETIVIVQDALDELDVTFLATDLAADGVKVIATAGVPVTVEDADDRVLRALRRVVERDPPLPVRAGVHRGHVFSGEVGPAFRRTYTVIGDVVNTAARVMAKAVPGEVLALEAVLDASHTRFATDRLEPFLAKGKSEPLTPYRVGPVAGPAHGRSRRELLPLCGRDSELRALREAWDGAAAGAGRLVQIIGDAGLGKSRLVDELLATLGDGPVVATAACEPYEQATPYFAVRQLLRPLLGLDRTRPGAEILRLLLAAAAPALVPWAPLVGGVLDVDVDDTTETAALDPRYRRQRTNLAVTDLLTSILAGPAVLRIEDVHWIDDASAEVLGQVTTRCRHRPWLVCTTRRDEPGGFMAADGDVVQTVRLTALADTDMLDLVGAATQGTAVPPHRRAALVDRAGGNPLFLEELVATGAAGDDTVLPDSLEAAATARIDALGPADRRFLRHVSVLGSEFDLTLAAEVDGTSTAAAARALGRLDPLLVVEGDRVRFRHRIVRDAAYESLPFRRRQALHAAAAHAIESRLGGDPGDRVGVLSLHFLSARRYEPAWRYARLAGDRARVKFANVEAIELYERALRAARHLDAPDRAEVADVWEAMSEVADLAGDLSSARRACQSARRLLAREPARYARMTKREARVVQRLGDLAAMRRLIARGLLAVADGEGEAAVVRADLQVLDAWLRQQQGRPHEALRMAERALLSAEAGGNRRAIADALTVKNAAEVALGRTPDGAGTARALSIYDELGVVADRAVLLNNLGATAYYEGRWTDALALYTQSRNDSLRAGNIVDAGSSAFNMAEILADQGRYDEAEVELRAVAGVFEAVGQTVGGLYVADLAGRIAMRRGDTDEARRLLAVAAEGFDRAGLTAQHALTNATLAECLLRAGDLDAAEACLSGDATPALLRCRAYVHAARGRLDEARRDGAESLALARARRAPLDIALALELTALIGDDTGIGDSGLDERRAILRDLGVVAAPPPPWTGDGGAQALLAVSDRG